MSAYLKGGVVAVALMVGIWFWYRSVEKNLPSNQSPAEFQLIDRMETQGMPDFSLERLDGKKLKLSDYKGKMIIVNFWASWCNPCVEEFPSMVKLVERMKGDLVIIAISTDDERKDVEPFLKAFGVPRPGFEVVWDADKSVMKSYLVDRIPESFVVNTDFKLARKVAGIEDWASDDAVAFFKLLKSGKLPMGPGAGGTAER